MFCSKCGTEIKKENAAFCNKCGASLKEKASEIEKVISNEGETENLNFKETNISIPVVLPPRPEFKINKKVIAIIAAVAVVLCLIPVVKLILKPASPQSVAEKFFKELKSGNYEKAYELFDSEKLKGSEFLTAGDYKKSFEKSKITDFTIVKNKGKVDYSKSKEYQIEVNITLGQNNQKWHINLVNVSKGKSPKWKIDPSRLILETQIIVPSGMDLEVNNKKIALVNGDTIKIPMFGGYPFHVKVSNPDIKIVEKDAAAGDYIEFFEFSPSEELTSKITELINKYHQSSIETFKDCNVSHIEQCVKKESSLWYRYTNYFTMETAPEERSIKDLKFNEFSFEMGFTTNLDVIIVKTNEVWNSSIAGETVNNFVYTIERQPDGNWMITESYADYY